MEHNLYIPKKIKVGFQNRQGTFTGKLAYIIYIDDKGVLRKETSWQGWRDQKIEPLEFDNEPRAGFLFNKGVQRYGYHWGSGRSSIRVYDPRDFEFEINVDNLIGILMHSDVSKRDIVEECIYAWDGKELVLLPTNSDQYQNSLQYTKKQGENLSAKSLVKGYTYSQKKTDDVYTYIGYFEWFDWKYDSGYYNRLHKSMGKKHVFYNPKTTYGNHFITPTMASFSSVCSEEVVEDYSTLVEKFFTTINSQPIASWKLLVSKKNSNSYFYRLDGNTVKTFGFHSPINDYARKYMDYFSDNSINTHTFVQEDRSIRYEQNRGNYWHSYLYNNIGPVKKSFIEKATAMGFDPQTLSEDECVKVIEANDFQRGEFAFVLENGAECLYSL